MVGIIEEPTIFFFSFKTSLIYIIFFEHQQDVYCDYYS